MNAEALPLTERERARCDHPERTMHQSGRFSMCVTCGTQGVLNHVKSKLKPISSYRDDRTHIRLGFTVEQTLDDVAVLQLAFDFGGFSVELALEEDGMWIRMFNESDDLSVLISAAEWFHQRGYEKIDFSRFRLVPSLMSLNI